jgi:hypothetical protein
MSHQCPANHACFDVLLKRPTQLSPKLTFKNISKHWWLTPVILAAWETEI